MIRKLPEALRAAFDSNVDEFLTDPTAIMLSAAKSAIGVTVKDQATINLFRSTVGGANGESWCMSFVQSCIAYAEERTGARSPLMATELCMGLWDLSKDRRVKNPLPGDIIIWQFGQTIHGHTGFIVGSNSISWRTVEGNTSGATTIDANGNGVWSKIRAKGGSKTFIEVGFLRVFG